MSFLFEYIDINPKETIIRGCLAKKIPMDKSYCILSIGFRQAILSFETLCETLCSAL